MSITPIIIVIILLLVAYYSHRYAWWKKTITYRCPRILMYHMIREPIKGAKFNSLRVSPQIFEQQLRYLSENGWHFYTISELCKRYIHLPEKSIALTFDDGYEDNLINALPLLKKYNAKATIYLVVDRHQREWSSKRKKKNKSNELVLEPKLQDEQVKKLLASGLIEIGSHTLTHDNLPTLTKDKKYQEIVASRVHLQQTFSIACDAFCYPFGLYDQTDLEMVKQAGYSTATTVYSGIDCTNTPDLFQLKRITISGKDSFYAFRLKLKLGKRGVKK